MPTLEESAASYQAPKRSLEESAASYTAPVEELQSTVPSIGKAAPLEKPGFLKQAELIGSGHMKGSLNYTARLMNYVGKLTEGTPEETKIRGENPVARAYEYWTEKNAADAQKYAGASTLQGIGELGGELLTTAPVGGVLGGVSKAAQAVGKALPYGLKTLGKYATAGSGGALTLSALESQKFDPANPDAPYSAEQFETSLKNPVSAIAPMLGTKLATWADKARELNQAKEIFPNIMARHLKEPGSARQLTSILTDSVQNLTGFGKGVKLAEGIGDDISNYINTLSGGIAAKYSKDYKTVAAKEFQGALQNLKKGQDEMWDKPFKTAPISNAEEIKDIAIQAQDILKDSGIPTAGKASKLITQGLRKGNLTVNDVKNIASDIGNAAGDAYNMGGGTAAKMGQGLSDIRQQLIGAAQKNLSGNDLADYTAASTYSKNYFETMSQSSRIKDALYSELDAKNVIKSMMSEAEAIDKAKTLNLMTNTGQKATWAAKMAKALEDSGFEGTDKVNLSTFVNATRQSSQLPELMGDTYNAVTGLNKYLTAIQQSGEHKLSKYVGALGAVAGAGAVASGTAAIPVVAAIASYNVLASLANRSPLKSLLGILGKAGEKATGNKLSDSVYKHITNKVENLLIRGGYFLTEDGALEKKENK